MASVGGKASGGGGSSSGGGSLGAVYNATLPTYLSQQSTTLQTDNNGRLIVAPLSLIFSSALQTYSAQGVGADTVFPASVSAVGTSLGTLPAGAGRLQIHIPPGASVSGYVATATAANAGAAVNVSATYNNAAANTNNLDVTIDLNNSQQFWVTNYTSATASGFISGKPVFRFL